MESEPIAAAALLHLKVFPLPATVLFPGTVIPLHVFEDRYCNMVRDALDTDRCLAIAMVRPGADGDRPALYDTCCIGRIVHTEPLENGRYNILLHGTHRARLLEEREGHRGYRRFRAELIPDPTQESLAEAAPELVRLQSCVMNIRSLVAESDAQLVEVLRATPDLIALADILSAVLIPDPLSRQELLETTNVRLRLRRLIDALAEVMARVGEPALAAAGAKLN